MKRLSAVLALGLLAGLNSSGQASEPPKESLAQLQKAFADYSGVRLVFAASDLPEGSYHDAMPPLDENGRLRAARIALREVRKLPPLYPGKMGLKAVGIFAACVSHQGDGFRPYDEQLKGYRYFGIYNGKNALAAAYYSDAQLPTTLHHEIFHHVDATRRGESGHTANFTRDDRLKAALTGEEPYSALRIAPADLDALKKLGAGRVLEKAVSRYAEKSIGEDKAETARYLMTTLPDALVQMATRHELEGSQRLLHVLHKYGEAIPDGPGVEWFISVALGRPLLVAPPQPARTGEGKGKSARNKIDEALHDFAQAVRLDSRLARPLVARGKLDFKLQEYEKSIGDFSAALRLCPGDAETYEWRAAAFVRAGRYDRAIADCKQVLRSEPSNIRVHGCLAWYLAVSPDARQRDGKEACEYATTACEATEWKKPEYLEVLAAAYAERGDFERAVKWQARAVEIVSGTNTAYYRQRLELYQAHQPYHLSRTPMPVK